MNDSIQRNTKLTGIIVVVLMLTMVSGAGLAADRPNVILIATDDLTTWVGPLGSDMAKTPNLDRLAKMGVTFTNAHTAGIYCAPSRSALFTGRYASTTGCYDHQIYFYDRPEIRPLQKALQNGGYRTFGTGKLFHHPAGYLDLRGWTDFHVRTEEQKTAGWAMDSWEHGAPLPDPYPHSPFNQANEKRKGKPFMEVGPVPNDKEEEMADTIRTNWACDIIKQKSDKPFFVALGMYAPHYPNYAPQKYFDMYPLDSIKRPEWKEDDLEDLPDPIRKFHEARKRGIHDKLLEMGIIESTIQGYLACISYADAMVGRVLDALEESPNRDNTIVVFWSDHGYTHGQKGHWGKHTLWERTSHVPFLWAGPGIARNEKTDATASLVDIYATLVEMCGLEPDAGLDGESLVSACKKPESAKDRSVMLFHDEPGSYAVINRDWRYIHYADDTEELYDLSKDPHEWNNLAQNSKYDAVKSRLRAEAPQTFAPSATVKTTLNMVVEGETFHWVPKK